MWFDLYKFRFSSPPFSPFFYYLLYHHYVVPVCFFNSFSEFCFVLLVLVVSLLYPGCHILHISFLSSLFAACICLYIPCISPSPECFSFNRVSVWNSTCCAPAAATPIPSGPTDASEHDIKIRSLCFLLVRVSIIFSFSSRLSFFCLVVCFFAFFYFFYFFFSVYFV